LTYGLRRGELLGIQWDDVDFENRVIHIRHAVADVQNSLTGKMEVVIDSPKTKYSARDLPMSSEIFDMLQRISQTKSKNVPATGCVFCGQSGHVLGPRTWSGSHYNIFMRDMREYYQKQAPAVDIPILSPHELRHTRASLWVNEGKSLFAIASVMGWADLKMLRQRYAHSDMESNRKALDL